jgi:trans-aconitate methyltransferase
MSETFAASWLALREPVDHRSRAEGVLAPLTRWWSARGARSVLDLGCGTGSNLRYLGARLPGPQRWTCLDHDPVLLGGVRTPRADIDVRPLRGDLEREGLGGVPEAHLVTASALLDLVSRPWLERLVEACARSRCAGLFALSYDGAVEWPGRSDPVAREVIDAVNEHQRRDKGLGPALGPDAARTAEELFRARGYATWLLPSPWVLDARDAALSRELITGWVDAATELHPARAGILRGWRDGALTACASPGFRLEVGHLDLLALPSDVAAT